MGPSLSSQSFTKASAIINTPSSVSYVSSVSGAHSSVETVGFWVGPGGELNSSSAAIFT
jgi:hypothetical protein